MSTIIRTRLLTAVFCVSLAGLGVTASNGLLGQVNGSMPVVRNTIIDNDPLNGPNVEGFVSEGFVLSPNGALPGSLNDNVAYLNMKAVTRANNAYATWTFANLAPGNYVFYATWKGFEDAATKAPYYNSITATTVYANQKEEPVGIEVDGRSWFPVAKVTIKQGDTMAITLRGNKDSEGTFVLADGMLARLESIIPPVEPGSCPKIKPLCLIGSAECCKDGEWACQNGTTGASGCQPTIPPVEPGSCGNGTCDKGESAFGCDPTPELPNICQGHIFCPQDCGPIEPGSCGDGIMQENEQCDDGNKNAFDGCGNKCILCPIPSMVPPPPGCTYVPDPTIAENGCPKYPGGVLKCERPGLAVCGNGVVDGVEECDDKNQRPGDGCSSQCKKEFCGDGIVTVTLGENCDEGAANGTVHGNYKCATPKCVWAYCGDKIVQQDLGEQCDGTEGCTSDCKNVATIACKYQPKGLAPKCEMMLATRCTSLRGQQYATIEECKADIPACADGIDNDGDKLTDLSDKGCSSSSDTNEGDGNTNFTVTVKTQGSTATPGTTFTSSLVITNLGPDRVTSPVSFIIDPPEGFSVPERSGDGRCVREPGVENGVWNCTIKPEEFNGASQYFKSSFNMQVNANAICNSSSELAVFMSSTPQGAGANSSSKTPVKIVCSTQQSCKETDGGNVPEVAGTLTAFIRSSTTGQLERVEVKDSCVGTNPEVIEGYCVPDGLGGQNYSTISVRCPYGCADGACKKAPVVTCTDTDGGDNMYVKGMASSTNPQANETDVCIDGTKMKERYCDANNQLQTKEITCPLGCNDGACKKQPIAQCTMPEPTAAIFQNHNSGKLTGDVNNDGLVDISDFMVLRNFYNSAPIGYKPAVSRFTYGGVSYENVFLNVDGSFNEKGVETFTIEDILPIISYIRCTTPKLAINSADFSCSAEGVPSIALGYTASAVPGPVHLFGEQGQWLYTGEDLTSSKTSATLTLIDNIVLPVGMKVKICDKTDKTKCSPLFTSTGTACQQKITFDSAVYSTENGIDYLTASYTKNFRTCVHMSKKLPNGTIDRNLAIQNHFCNNTGPIKVAILPTNSNPSGGIKVAPGDKVQLCHGNNGNICNSEFIEVTRSSAPVTCTQAPVRNSSAKWQNVYNALDVDGNWKIEAADVDAITYFMTTYGQGTPGASVVSSLKPDVNGDLSVDAQDVAIVGAHVSNNCGQQSITMNGPALLSCQKDAVTGENVSIVTVNYVAKFIPSTSLHVRMQGSSVIPGSVNPNQTSGSVPYAKFTGATAATKVYLCHGNDSKVCSTPVAIEGTGCGTNPATAMLYVTVKNIGTANTVARNQKNVNLLAFDVQGSPNNAVVTSIVAKAAAGSPLNAQNYTLWADIDYNGIVETKLQSGVAAQGGFIRFDSLTGGGRQVAFDKSTRFEIHGDIASSTVDNTLRLELATATAGYVAAEQLDGTELVGIKTNGACPAASCAINVTTVPSITLTIVSGGNLFVTQDSTPVRGRQLLAGVLSEPVMRLQFRAHNENIIATTIRFISVGGRATSVDSLDLVREGETSAFATATISACGDVYETGFEGVVGQTFCASLQNKQLVVPSGQTVKVLVKARLKNDGQGALSNDPIQFAIPDFGEHSGGFIGALLGQGQNRFSYIEARGEQSSANLLINDNDSIPDGEVYIGTDTPGPSNTIRGTKHVTVLSKLTSITNANPDADNTNVPTGVSPIGQFKFTAATNSNTMNGLNKVKLTSLRFNVTYSNVTVAPGRYMFYNKADTSTKLNCSVVGGGGGGGQNAPYTITDVVECANLDTTVAGNDIDNDVDSGASDTFVLEANIVNPQIATAHPAFIQASISNFSTPFPTESNVAWTDKDAGSIGTGNTTSSNFRWFDSTETEVKSTKYGSSAGTTVLSDNATCNTMPGYSIRNVGNVIAGSNFQATMVMDNPGPSTWVVGAAAPYNLSILPETNWGLSAATHNSVINQPAETQVKPGQVFSFDFYPLKAPATPGTYPIKIQMKKNGVPFGSVCTHNIVVKAATQPPVLTGDNCPDVKTAKAQMALFGTAGKFRATSDGKYLLWAEVVGGMSKNVKGVNFDTCETTLFGTTKNSKTGIDEISISDGTNPKILYKDRTVIGDGSAQVYDLWLVDKNTKAKTLVTDKAISNGTGDRALISRDGNSIVMTAWGANIDNDPSTSYSNADGSRELFRIKSGVITQITNFNGGQSTYKDAAGTYLPNQWTNMNDAQFEDAAGRFITVDLDWDPNTGKRHERNVLTTAAQPSDIVLWEYRLYLYDTQTKTFYRISDTKNPMRESLRAQINAKMAEITGGAVSQGFIESFLSRIVGSILR